MRPARFEVDPETHGHRGAGPRRCGRAAGHGARQPAAGADRGRICRRHQDHAVARLQRGAARADDRPDRHPHHQRTANATISAAGSRARRPIPARTTWSTRTATSSSSSASRTPPGMRGAPTAGASGSSMSRSSRAARATRDVTAACRLPLHAADRRRIPGLGGAGRASVPEVRPDARTGRRSSAIARRTPAPRTRPAPTAPGTGTATWRWSPSATRRCLAAQGLGYRAASRSIPKPWASTAPPAATARPSRRWPPALALTASEYDRASRIVPFAGLQRRPQRHGGRPDRHPHHGRADDEQHGQPLHPRRCQQQRALSRRPGRRGRSSSCPKPTPPGTQRAPTAAASASSMSR